MPKMKKLNEEEPIRRKGKNGKMLRIGEGNGRAIVQKNPQFEGIIDATRAGLGHAVIPVKEETINGKRVVGRPSKYDPKFCDMLVRHMAQGGMLETFAAIAHVGIATARTWAHEHEEFQAAKSLGDGYRLSYWLAVGKAIALDDPSFQLEVLGVKPFLKKRTIRRSTKTDEEEETLEYHVPRGNTGTYCYLMNNMFRAQGWRNPTSIEHTGKDGGPIQTESKNLHAVALSRLSIEQLEVLDQIHSHSQEDENNG